MQKTANAELNGNGSLSPVLQSRSNQHLKQMNIGVASSEQSRDMQNKILLDQSRAMQNS